MRLQSVAFLFPALSVSYSCLSGNPKAPGALVNSEDLNGATTQFEYAHHDDSNYAPAFGIPGIVYRQEGRRLDAQRMFEQLLVLESDDLNAAAYLNL